MSNKIIRLWLNIILRNGKISHSEKKEAGEGESSISINTSKI